MLVLLVMTGSHVLANLAALFLAYDVLIAHLTHFLDPRAGAAVGRTDPKRSLTIALINIGVLVMAFALGFRVLESVNTITALGMSWASFSTSGLYEPAGGAGKVLASFEVLVALVMITMVLGTILADVQATTMRAVPQKEIGCTPSDAAA